jgi:acylphosphatase
LKARAEIIVNGLVQGVGFRYFVYREAVNLGLHGLTKNLYTGEVLTVAEGERALLEELIKKIRVGPSHASVKNCKVEWQEFLSEFNNFEIQ